MSTLARFRHAREAQFLGAIVLTTLLVALYLADGLRLAALGGSGHRVIDRVVLERRIDAGDLRDREADWYHKATQRETGGAAP
jgi:hypothetical protein